MNTKRSLFALYDRVERDINEAVEAFNDMQIAKGSTARAYRPTKLLVEPIVKRRDNER